MVTYRWELVSEIIARESPRISSTLVESTLVTNQSVPSASTSATAMGLPCSSPVRPRVITVAVSNSCKRSKKCCSGPGASPAEAILLGTWFMRQVFATRMPHLPKPPLARKKPACAGAVSVASPHRGKCAQASGFDDHDRLARSDGLAFARDHLDHHPVDRGLDRDLHLHRF